MDIIYLGHACFRLKFKDAVVITDPFDPKMVGFKFPIQEADIVTVSHTHPDHSNLGGVRGVKKVINAPGEYEVKGVSVIGLPAYHDDKKGEERGKNTLYIFEAEGLRIAHLGDLGHTLSEKEIEEIGEIHVLMLPVGGEVSLDAEKAVQVVRSIEPAITIPMHYQEAGLNQEVFAKLSPVEDFLKEIGLTVEKLPKLSIKISDLGEEQKIVLLERK